MSELPLEHVERVTPPWRLQHVTECGLPVEGHPVISRAGFVAKVKAQGKQRAAMTTCMTCWDSAGRNEPWDESPVESLIRECERHRWAGRSGQRDPDQFRRELLAIAALIEAHRDEFDDMVAGLGDTVRLSDRRAQRRWQQGGSR